jgi:hypothetical protein
LKLSLLFSATISEAILTGLIGRPLFACFTCTRSFLHLNAPASGRLRLCRSRFNGPKGNLNNACFFQPFSELSYSRTLGMPTGDHRGVMVTNNTVFRASMQRFNLCALLGQYFVARARMRLQAPTGACRVTSTCWNTPPKSSSLQVNSFGANTLPLSVSF